jgi:hypothetical protein
MVAMSERTDQPDDTERLTTLRVPREMISIVRGLVEQAGGKIDTIDGAAGTVMVTGADARQIQRTIDLLRSIAKTRKAAQEAAAETAWASFSHGTVSLTEAGDRAAMEALLPMVREIVERAGGKLVITRAAAAGKVQPWGPSGAAIEAGDDQAAIEAVMQQDIDRILARLDAEIPEAHKRMDDLLTRLRTTRVMVAA